MNCRDTSQSLTVIDDTDNINVCSKHKLQKFTGSGELIKCIGRKGRKEGKFDVPHGLMLYDNQKCDHNNHLIEVFDLDFNFVRSIGSHGNGRGEFNKPCDVNVDTPGNMYIAEKGNKRVQVHVMDSGYHFIRTFGAEEGKLHWALCLHIADKYVYVSDSDCIVVYETSDQFVKSFGEQERERV